MALTSVRDPSFNRAFALICVTVTGVALAAAALVYLYNIVLLLVLAFVLVELLCIVADPLARKLGGPRGLYVGLTMLAVLAVFAGLVALFVFPLADQAHELAEAIPRYIER